MSSVLQQGRVIGSSEVAHQHQCIHQIQAGQELRVEEVQSVIMMVGEQYILKVIIHKVVANNGHSIKYNRDSQQFR